MGQSFLDADAIRAATFVRHVEVHDTLGSTNDRAAELARDDHIELPALVVARHQTAGRGRGQNKWWSADGALTFSLLLEPAAMGIQTANWPQLSLATAVAVCDALRAQIDNGNPKSALRLSIKWPNDILLDGRKLSGILIESPGGSAPAKDRLIIGIGINVNNSMPFVGHDSAMRACALCDATGRKHDLQAVLAIVLVVIAERLAQLRDGDAELLDAWQRLDLLAGQTVMLEAEGRRIEGQCVGIARDGALAIDTSPGTQRFYSGSVRPTQ